MGTLGPQRFLQDVYTSDEPLFSTLSRCLGMDGDAIEARFKAAVLAGEKP